MLGCGYELSEVFLQPPQRYDFANERRASLDKIQITNLTVDSQTPLFQDNIYLSLILSVLANFSRYFSFLFDGCLHDKQWLHSKESSKDHCYSN